MTEIAQRQLRNDNAEIMRRVEAGETFTVTRNGVPVAELRPLPAPRRRFVPTGELTHAFAGSERIDFARFRADLDAVVDPWLDPD